MPTASRTLPAATNLKGMLERAPAALDFVLPGLLRGTVGGFISPGGMGKSFWALEAAVAISGGTRADLTGLNPVAGKVVMFAGEDPQEILAQRVRSLMDNLPKAVGAAALASLDYRSCYGIHIDLMDDGWFQQMLEAAKNARLVVLDTLTRFHNLDENSAQDMKRLLGRMELLAKNSGAAVMYLHHTSKSSAVNGQAALQQAARGSSVLTDNARWAAFLANMTELEAKQFEIPQSERAQYVRWNISKQNYGPALADIWFKRAPGGVLMPMLLTHRKCEVLTELVPTRMGADGAPEVYARSMGSGRRPVPARGARALVPGVTGLVPEGRPALTGVPSAKGKYDGNW